VKDCAGLRAYEDRIRGVGDNCRTPQRGLGRDAGSANGDFEMSREHFGAAVVVVGLLTASPIAMGEAEEGSHARTEISGYSGWDHSVAALIIDSNEVADDNGADTQNTRASPLENDPMYAIIPPTTRNSIISDSPAVDPFRTTFDTGNSDNIGTFANKSAHRSVSTITGSSRALRLVSHATSTLPPAGCARCTGQVARASAGRAKSFASLFSWNFSHKGGFRPRHSMTAIVRQRTPPLLMALAEGLSLSGRPVLTIERFVSTPL
jgi:hypothetical protein